MITETTSHRSTALPVTGCSRAIHSIASIRQILNYALLICLVVLLCNCTGYHPVPLQEVQFHNGVQTKGDGNITVSTAILNEDEAEKVFGLDLSDQNIQAVWIRVINESENIYFLLKTALDADYFSAYEVAYMEQSIWHPGINDKIVRRFRELAFRNPVPPHRTVEGFLFVNQDECHRQIDIDLATYGEILHFTFFFELGMGATTLFDVQKSHASEPEINIDTEHDLRKTITRIPPVTTDSDGNGTGDPVNLILVGNADDLFPAFVRRHWHITEETQAHSVLKMIESFIFGTHYLHSPISPLYLFGRKQDIALQKARETVNQRNHLRLWLTPYRYMGKRVWAGTISRDVGIRFTFLSPFLVTHKIDPDVDEVRNSFGTDMLVSGNLRAVGFAAGGIAYSPDKPGHNLTGDIYFTDGLRLVLFLTNEIMPLESTRFLEWEPPQGRHM